MKWADIKKMSEYQSPLSAVSIDTKGHSLINASDKVFNIEKYAKANGYNCSVVDAISVKVDKNLNLSSMALIEFKGGTNPFDWEDHKDNTLYKKAFDTIHIILRDLIDNTDIWQSIFSDDCILQYFICLDSKNTLFSVSSTSKEKLHTRAKTVKIRNKIWKSGIFSPLSNCRGGHPFSNIEVIKADSMKTYI